MKANRARNLAQFVCCVGLAALTASCAQPRKAPPAPVPAAKPSPLPALPQALSPAPRTADWRDAAITPGTWRWRMEGARSVARFADNALVLSCDREAGQITLIRSGAGDGQVPMTVLTATTRRNASGSAQPGPPPVITLTLPARDPLLDAMAFSRGRFAVETAGLPTLYVPSWAEITRVVEDCR